MAGEGKLAKQILGESRPARSLGTAEQSITAHPMFQDALETLALQKKLDPVKYNELLNQQADEIAKNIRRPLPGGNKGTSYPVGPESTWVYYTTPEGKLGKITRGRESEIPKGSTVHNLTREDVVRELGGLREVPPPAKPTPSSTAATNEAVAEALDVTRQRRLAEEAAAAPVAPPPASGPYTPTPGYGTSTGPWGTAATSSPMPGLLNDRAYAAWLKDVNRRANDLTQAGAAAGAGALYYRGLPQGAGGQEGGGGDGGFTPRPGLPNMSAPSTNYSPVTDTAKDVLRQRVNAPLLSPLSDSVSHDESRSDMVPALGPAPYMDEGRSAYDSVLGALPLNPGRGSVIEVPGARAEANAARPAPSVSRSTATRPTSSSTTSAPVTDRGNQSFFSSLIDRLRPQDPYAGMSARQMYERAQDMQRSGDEVGSNVLIQRAGQMPDAGMNRGGTAKPAGPHKDAALHKALDIIHAMMTRGR